MEHDGQWVGLNIAESLLAAPETLVHVSHTFYVVPFVSAYQV